MSSFPSRTMSGVVFTPVWEYYADGRAQWFKCDDVMAQQCEHAFTTLSGNFNYTLNGKEYTVNIFDMTQLNTESNYLRRLRRNGSESGPSPPAMPRMMMRGVTDQISYAPPVPVPEYKHVSDLQFTQLPEGEMNDVVILLDESGSMESMKIEARQSVEMFIHELYASASETEDAELREKLMNVTVKVYTFATTYNILFVYKVKELQTFTINYHPNGATDLYSPLYDILSRNIPADVFIVSDGENNTGPFNAHYIRRQINSAKMAGWTFKFVGCNEESLKEASTLHMGDENTCIRSEEVEGAPPPLIGMMRAQSSETSRRNMSRASSV